MPALPPDALRRRCDPATIPFETSADAPDVHIVGQERAVDALRFAVDMRQPDYHVFALGPEGIGRHAAVRAYLEERAKAQPVPPDWCYLHDFDDPDRPKALSLPPGRGRVLDDDLARLIDALGVAVRAALDSEEFRKAREATEASVGQEGADELEAIRRQASADKVAVIETDEGFQLTPLTDGQPIQAEAFAAMPEPDRDRFQKAMDALRARVERMLDAAPRREHRLQEKVRELESAFTAHAVDGVLADLRAKWADQPGVIAHLDAVRKDVVARPSVFAQDDEDDGPKDGRLAGLPPTRRYGVNVLVDRTGEVGAPIVYEPHPTATNLVGRMEHLALLGALLTDFGLIRAGALHQANGGYLVLDAAAVLGQPFAWETLLRALRLRELRMEAPDIPGLGTTLSLEPEPIPLDVKVVLVGDRVLYYLLAAADPEFRQLFKVPADFVDHVDWTPENVVLHARLLATSARADGIRPLRRDALARAVEQAARIAEDATRLSIHLQALHDLLREADREAAAAGAATIGEEHVEAAVAAADHRGDRVRELVQEDIARGIRRIAVRGHAVGEINALAAVDLGTYRFGHPTRVTATARLGRGGVIDIEREVRLGGPIHTKGVLILQGLVASRYAKDVPLSLAATLVFEQSYGEIEGDSASLAELLALLSAIGEVPLRQSIAVTGAVDQHGSVEAIGGVNEKIEGFFDVVRATDGDEPRGVVIPRANVAHLMLRKDVVAAVEAGRFAVWAVDGVDEAIELFTGLPAGERDAAGRFPEGSVNRRVEDRLIALAKAARQWAPRPE